jgi:polysaccharide export outer membrane protein
MRKPAAIFAFLLIASSCLVAAQQQNTSFQVSNTPQTVTPEEIIRQFGATEMTSYTLGNGDEITVDVWNHAELSGHHVIGPDGKITLPIAGVLKVAGLTREEAQTAVMNGLSRYYSDLAVTVRVDRYTSYRIYVVGRPGAPGELQFDTQPTLLDVLARATPSPITIPGTGSASLGRCAIIRGRDQMVWIDMKSLLVQGNMTLNLPLARNDLVYLQDTGDQVVYVLGEVNHPGAYRITPTMSFLDAFSQSGGLTEDAAKKRIELIRSRSGVQREFELQDLLTRPQNFNFALQEGDIIYVQRSNMAKFGYVLRQTSPLAAFAVIGTVGTR